MNNHSGSGKTVSQWPKWLPKYKDFIELWVWIIGAAVAVFTLLSISSQVDSLRTESKAIADQTEALKDQVKAQSDQTDAIRKHIDATTELTKAMFEQGHWTHEQVNVAEFQNRAELAIKGFETKDILPNKGRTSLVTGDDVGPDSTLYFDLHFSVLNQGKTTATIDSATMSGITICSGQSARFSSTITSLVGVQLKPDGGSNVVLPFSISKMCDYIGLIDIVYNWDKASGGTGSYHLKKYAQLIFRENLWHLYTLPPSQFDSLTSVLK